MTSPPEDGVHCRCVWSGDDEVDATECWLHGTPEGREWLQNSHESVRYDLLEQARNALYRTRDALREWARYTDFRSNVNHHQPVESQTLHRMDEVIAAFHRENDAHTDYERETGRVVQITVKD